MNESVSREQTRERLRILRTNPPFLGDLPPRPAHDWRPGKTLLTVGSGRIDPDSLGDPVVDLAQRRFVCKA